MAPEQRRGEVLPASDLFAAAVVLYEMLVGHAPWTRDVVMAGTRRRDDFRLPDDARAAAGALADALDEHLLHLGDPDPALRPTTAQALAESQRLRERAIAADIT